ncbi:MAG: hypothetical protein R3B41_02680 [Candidatus Doudnabacteria bacterium]
MDLSNIKKNNETVWAGIFLKYINQALGAEYKLVPELEENSPVDVHLVDPTANFPHLDLQLTHAVEVPFVALEAHTDVDFSKKPTIDAIERKLKKLKTQKADLSKIVLIIQGYMNAESARQVFADSEFEKYKDYPFLGIYYVSPDMYSAETQNEVQSGLVEAIKSISF